MTHNDFIAEKVINIELIKIHVVNFKIHVQFPNCRSNLSAEAEVMSYLRIQYTLQTRLDSCVASASAVCIGL